MRFGLCSPVPVLPLWHLPVLSTCGLVASVAGCASLDSTACSGFALLASGLDLHQDQDLMSRTSNSHITSLCVWRFNRDDCRLYRLYRFLAVCTGFSLYLYRFRSSQDQDQLPRPNLVIRTGLYETNRVKSYRVSHEVIQAYRF